MSEQTFTELDRLKATQGAEATIEHLISVLRSEKRHHDLFDALLLKSRVRMGLPLTRPTSFADVPAEKSSAFEEQYIAAAREVGELFLADGDIPKAWMYLKPVKETQKVKAAIEALHPSRVDDEIMHIALFEGVAPVRGTKMMLAAHGTCSTITSLDQQLPNLPPDSRRGCAALLVAELYRQLRDNLEHEVRRRNPLLEPGLSIRELIAGRDEVFAEDAYHIDVSHLNAVVRFARSLDRDSPELKQAVQLAQYGSRLSPQYQYAGSPPFEEFYPAHLHYFRILLGENADEGLEYFRGKLGPETDDPNNQLAAFVLVDLLQRVGKNDEALDIACRYLAKSADEFGLSIAELCASSGKYDRLKQVAREQNDLIAYTAALLS
jgi:hypothetical protein